MITINSNNPNAGSNIFFIFVTGLILILLGASKCEAQGIERMARFDNEPHVITKFAAKPLIFGEDDSLIVLNIMVDSLSQSQQRIIIYAFYPLRVGKSLKIGFENGEIINLPANKTDSNYVEYWVSGPNYVKLKDNKFDYVNFVGVAQCLQIENKAFFRDFLKTAVR